MRGLGRARLPGLRRHAPALCAALVAITGPAAAPAPPELALLPIKLLDTSGEPTDQNAAHAARLAALAAALAADLADHGLYRPRLLRAADVARACPREAPACLLATARAAGADLVFLGVVHKSSTLILQMWARIVDARSGQVLFSRELNFRGDNDEAWRRAAAFLAAQVRSDPPHPDP